MLLPQPFEGVLNFGASPAHLGDAHGWRKAQGPTRLELLPHECKFAVVPKCDGCRMFAARDDHFTVVGAQCGRCRPAMERVEHHIEPFAQQHRPRVEQDDAGISRGSNRRGAAGRDDEIAGAAHADALMLAIGHDERRPRERPTKFFDCAMHAASGGPCTFTAAVLAAPAHVVAAAHAAARQGTLPRLAEEGAAAAAGDSFAASFTYERGGVSRSPDLHEHVA